MVYNVIYLCLIILILLNWIEFDNFQTHNNIHNNITRTEIVLESIRFTNVIDCVTLII